MVQNRRFLLLNVKVHAPNRASRALSAALLTCRAGRREIAGIARFAIILTQRQHHRLGLLQKKGTQSFYKVPGYNIFYQALTRMAPEAFAAVAVQWAEQNHTRAGWLLNEAGLRRCDLAEWVQAKPLLRRGLEILVAFTRTTQHRHPHLQATANNYTKLLRAQGRSEAQIRATLRALGPELFSG